MNAKDAFPDDDVRKDAKEIVKYWGAIVTKIYDDKGNVIYESNLDYDKKRLD